MATQRAEEDQCDQHCDQHHHPEASQHEPAPPCAATEPLGGMLCNPRHCICGRQVWELCRQLPMTVAVSRSKPRHSRDCFHKTIHEILAEFRWRGEGLRPRVAPRARIPARAPRAIYALRDFPPKTSGPATVLFLDVGCPAPPWRPGLVLTHRTSHVRPIQPARPVRMINARPKLSRRVCIFRGSRTAGGPSRFAKQGCAADGTADGPEVRRAATSASMWE